MMMTWVEETTKSCSFSALKKHFHKSASHLPILSFGAFVVFNNCCDIDMYIFGISRGSVASNGPHRGVEIYCFTVFLDPEAEYAVSFYTGIRSKSVNSAIGAALSSLDVKT